MTALTPSTLQSKWWLHQRGGHRCRRSSTLSPFASRHTMGIIINACQIRVRHESGALCWFVSVHFETHDYNRDVFWRQFRVQKKTVENVSPRMQDCRVQNRRSSWQARESWTSRQFQPSTWCNHVRGEAVFLECCFLLGGARLVLLIAFGLKVWLVRP